MAKEQIPYTIHTVLSLDPLLDFWREKVAPNCPHMAAMFDVFEKRVRQTPELNGDIEKPAVAADHQDILAPLMSVVFPQSTWETELSGAFTPFTHQPIFLTPAYEKRLLDADGKIAGRFKGVEKGLDHHRLLRSYALILHRLYGIDQNPDSPMVRIVTDPDSGLERYFQIISDFQFVQVGTVGSPLELSERDREQILSRMADIGALTAILPPEKFILRGFTVDRAMEVTESEVVSAIERDLIDQKSIFSAHGFKRLQDRLCTLFGQPNLKAGLAGLQGEQVLIFNDRQASDANCLFTNSSHIPMEELTGSIWSKAVQQKKIVRISDLRKKSVRCASEQELVDHGVRSIMVAPLFFGGDAVGTFCIRSNQPDTLDAVDAEKMGHIAPLFSMALKRGLEDMDNEVQAIIKTKCTAIHPSVEWRFRRAAIDHMERIRRGEPSEMETIVFKNVIPLFGQSDIRGSSEARIQGVQADLTEQLTLADAVMGRAGEIKSWSLISELRHRITRKIEDIRTGLSAEEERLVASFLQAEVEPCFDELRRIGPGVGHAIDRYNRAIDPAMGVVYEKRKAFEESVSSLNEQLSAYLDGQQRNAQQVFPHYFEKHQTDGVDYVIYLGASMHPKGNFNAFYLKSLVLWQLEVACGLARKTAEIQSSLKVPLDTCHLVLVNHSPLSIRFRYDEKRFDVDGAYDVRHEIIKSRLDKAMAKGGKQRLTQPGKIAIVYSHPDEGLQMHHHIEYLSSCGYLCDGTENLDLEDLPGVRGLKALRVAVNMEKAVALPETTRNVG